MPHINCIMKFYIKQGSVKPVSCSSFEEFFDCYRNINFRLFGFLLIMASMSSLAQAKTQATTGGRTTSEAPLTNAVLADGVPHNIITQPAETKRTESALTSKVTKDKPTNKSKETIKLDATSHFQSSKPATGAPEPVSDKETLAIMKLAKRKKNSKVRKNIRKARQYPMRAKPKPVLLKAFPPPPQKKLLSEYNYSTNDKIRLICRIRPTSRYSNEKITIQDDEKVLPNKSATKIMRGRGFRGGWLIRVRK